MEPKIQKEILGQYEVLNELGRGAFSVVKRGYDTVNKKEVALKILFNYNLEDKIFKAEVNSLAKLYHSNIVQLYDVKENVKWVKLDGSCE